MTPTERASLHFQAPDFSQSYPFQPMQARWVCPTCRHDTSRYLVSCDGHSFETDRCPAHGDVIAILQHFPLETPA